jgi:undecaprenyl-diphosphatase
MTIIQAIILGIAQGITEFLPISSDGHLAVAHMVLEVPSDLLFDVLLHLATLGAIIFFFWKTIIALRLRQWIYLGLATIPAAIAGILFGDWIELSAGIPMIVAAGFLVTAIIDFTAQYFLNKQSKPNFSAKPVGLSTLMKMGVMQTFALLPGLSRSGITVATALGLSAVRLDAFHWSFLLAIPAIAGATGLELVKTATHGGNWPPLIPTLAGMIAAFIAGMASLFLLRLMLQKAHLWYFGVYCLAMAAIVLLLPAS